MELISFGKEMLQNAAEHAASYRFGQTVLRQFDKVLWVVEKCARWAVPPPLDQDERPQPELVRPLPWVFFLMMLVVLRVTRESISLANLIMGKPPLRSADVVMFIQGKRRYLRTLKYQGNRIMRARTSSSQTQQPWYINLQSLFELTMCFRRQSMNYGNNNTTRITNNDEVVIIKGKQRVGQDESPTVSNNETTMVKLIEKMMVDLDAESDEDSNFTLTNELSHKSDQSELTESDQDTFSHSLNKTKTDISQTNGDDIHFLPNVNESSTPEAAKNKDTTANGNESIQSSSPNSDLDTQNSASNKEKRRLDEEITETALINASENLKFMDSEDTCDSASVQGKIKIETENFLNAETASQNSLTPKKDQRVGRKFKIWSSTMRHFFHPKSNGQWANGKECAQQEERKHSQGEAVIKRSASTKSATLKHYVLRKKRSPIKREVVSE